MACRYRVKREPTGTPYAMDAVFIYQSLYEDICFELVSQKIWVQIRDGLPQKGPSQRLFFTRTTNPAHSGPFSQMGLLNSSNLR